MWLSLLQRTVSFHYLKFDKRPGKSGNLGTKLFLTGGRGGTSRYDELIVTVNLANVS